jgi:HEPN domain
MKVDEKNIERLRKLVLEIDSIRESVYHGEHEYESFVAPEKTYEWAYKSLNALENIFGDKSKFFVDFKEYFGQFGENDSLNQISISEVWKVFGIIKAAESEYSNGYVYKLKTLVQAEMFDQFLEQADELFKKGYYQPAAVIAGCVLEDGLRKLCDRNSITLPAKATIEPMNVELRKADIYNMLWQKKITALADLRNKAAHGEWTEFTEKDVEDMIRDVRRFMEDYFS